MSHSLKCITEVQDHHYHFTHRPSIRPYVCSTSSDLQEEKDHLAQYIFPQLNKFAFSRGSTFKPVDLRWETEERDNSGTLFREHTHPISSQQLKLSLDYINKSSPFFICILGHRYGEFVSETQCNRSISSPDLPNLNTLSRVEQNLIVAENNGYPWVLEGSNKHCSLTELEIIEAAFSSDAHFNYFYFRDHTYIEEKLKTATPEEKKLVLSTFASKNELEESKIWELKIRIVDRGLPVRFFKTKEELSHLVLKDWYDVIEKVYPLSATPANIGHEHNLVRAYNEAFAENLCKDFVSSKQLEELITDMDNFAFSALRNKKLCYSMESDSTDSGSRNITTPRSQSSAVLKSYLLIHGVRGCGKSTLVAKCSNPLFCWK
ncbi:tetratricopeptide repeat protein 41-like [Pelobates fuscus]|uniref:tetratricopeptide repeat protein 41-like n=1 Tax=Pelobates fuscus TaxID=191477 RepID=UPI002FE43ADA